MEKCENKPSENCAEKLQNDPKAAVPKQTSNKNAISYFQRSSTEKKIMDLVQAGNRVMVLMRGASGSGKSYLARLLVKRIMPHVQKRCFGQYIYSTDNYFKKIKRPKCRSKITRAHKHNAMLVERKAIEGAELIVIDNTNLQIWEMIPYVKIALRRGYTVETLEPQTPWKNSAKLLAEKNTDKVSLSKIQFMLDRFEHITAEKLVSMVTAQIDAARKINSNQKDENPPVQNKNVQNTSAQNILKESNQNDQPIDLENAYVNEIAMMKLWLNQFPLPQRKRFQNIPLEDGTPCKKIKLQ